jgi:hypothetical protein
MVPRLAERVEKPWRRDDAEEAPDVHHAIGASGIFRPEHAVREDELHCEEPRTLRNKQWKLKGSFGMENEFDCYH